MAAPKKTTKYQNISTMQTSVMRESSSGDAKSFALAPRAIVALTPDDVELTKDRCSPREQNCFDMGLVKAIPAGKSEHPDLGPSPKRMDAHTITNAMVEGTVDDVEALVATAQDMGHMVAFDRALQSVRQGMPETKIDAIDEVMTERRTEIAKEAKKRGQKLDAQIRG